MMKVKKCDNCGMMFNIETILECGACKKYVYNIGDKEHRIEAKKHQKFKNDFTKFRKETYRKTLPNVAHKGFKEV